MKIIKGKDASPILPFLMLDVMYQVYTADISHLSCKQEVKNIKNQWVKTYNDMNRRFFSVFSEEDKMDVVDLMDLFETHISDDIVRLKANIIQSLPSDISFEDRKVIASGLICNIMTQSANIVWKHVYVNRRNNDIERLEKLSAKWSSLFFNKKKNGDFDPNKSPIICKSVDFLCKRMVSWLKTI